MDMEGSCLFLRKLGFDFVQVQFYRGVVIVQVSRLNLRLGTYEVTLKWSALGKDSLSSG